MTARQQSPHSNSKLAFLHLVSFSTNIESVAKGILLDNMISLLIISVVAVDHPWKTKACRLRPGHNFLSVQLGWDSLRNPFCKPLSSVINLGDIVLLKNQNMIFSPRQWDILEFFFSSSKQTKGSTATFSHEEQKLANIRTVFISILSHKGVPKMTLESKGHLSYSKKDPPIMQNISKKREKQKIKATLS